MGFSVKVKKDDLLKIRAKIEKAFSEATSQKEMSSYGTEMAEQIKKRTRLGKGVNSDGKQTPLAPLSTKPKSTVDSRKKKKEKGTLSQLTTPKRSNLTDSGQMLDSIKVKSASSGVVELGFSERRSDGKSNSDIAKYAEEGSSNRPKREFFNLADFEIEKIKRTIRDKIKKLLGN